MSTINIYNTQTMLAAIRKMKPVHTFLRSTFFPGMTTFVTEEVMLDFKKGKRKMAPFVAPRVGGITMDRQGYRTDRYKAPKIAPQRATTVDDLVIRGMGENVFSSKTPAARQAELLGQDLAEMDDMITRREEWMVREMLFGGKITMKGYNDRTDSLFVEETLDYKFTNKETLSTKKWGTADAEVLEDLERWRLEVIKKSGKAPTICVLGQSAKEAFMKDAKVKEKMDLRNMYLGQINPVIISDAVTYIGRLAELGLDIYTYNEWFIDDDGAEKPLVPVDHILLGRPNMGELLYGAITQLEKDTYYTYEGNRVPKGWSEEKNDIRMIRLSSRPVPKPEDVDDWFVADVL